MENGDMERLFYKGWIAEIVPPLRWYEEQVARCNYERKLAAARGDGAGVAHCVEIIERCYAPFMWELRRDMARAVKKLRVLG